MQLRDSFQKKGKKLFNKTVHSLKHLLDSRHKFPKPSSSSFRPFSCASCRENGKGKGWRLPSLRDYTYPGFSGKWPGVDEVDGEGGLGDGDEPVVVGAISFGKRVTDSVPKEMEKEEEGEKPVVGNSGRSMRGGEEGGYMLAKKMKELEMMEVGDMEHVLDVEEALHYYSRLTSTVYVGIVDQFFMDMYSDFSQSPARRALKVKPQGKKPGNKRTTGWSIR